jgi:hydrogenase 3 maturation protease
MLTELKSSLKGKRILLLGVGNRLRGDDAVGSLLIERLKGKVDVPLIDAGDVPENYLGPIEESGAELVLVVDAADMGAQVGDVALFDIEQVQGMSVSTHSANLGLLFQVIPPETRPEVLLLGIQPGNIEFGQGLSEPVRATLESLAEMLVLALNEKARNLPLQESG